jgi:fructokinase
MTPGHALDVWLAGQGVHPVARRSLSGGFRTDNQLLETATGQRYVLRRYPAGSRAAVEAALAAVAPVPVPEVVAADPDGAAAGEPVLLTRFVPGVPLSTVTADEATGRAVGGVLAAIGTVTFDAPGFFHDASLTPAGEPLSTGLVPFVERCLATADLPAADADGIRALAARSAPLLATVDGARQLVHADFNPKNLLVAPDGDGWRVSAVLDWEFAFSGPPLVDVANMLRFTDETPPSFRSGFVAGFQAAGGALPEDWVPVSHALDLYPLADFLTRGPGHPFHAKALRLLRQRYRGAS